MFTPRTLLLLPAAALAVMAASSPLAYAQGSGRTIPIVAKRGAYVPSAVHLKKGEAVTLILTSQEAKVAVTPDAAGKFTATCNKFCGPGHLDMKLVFVVE